MTKNRDFNQEPARVGEEIGLCHYNGRRHTYYRARVAHVSPTGKVFRVDYERNGGPHTVGLNIHKWSGLAENSRADRYSDSWRACSLQQVEDAALADRAEKERLALARELEGPLQALVSLQKTLASGRSPDQEQVAAAEQAAHALVDLTRRPAL